MGDKYKNKRKRKKSRKKLLKEQADAERKYTPYVCPYAENWRADMQGRFPEDGRFLIKSLEEAAEKLKINTGLGILAYPDNIRFCLVGDEKSENDYQIASSHGCCGFYDKKTINPKTKREFWIGFNYGH